MIDWYNQKLGSIHVWASAFKTIQSYVGEYKNIYNPLCCEGVCPPELISYPNGNNLKKKKQEPYPVPAAQ